MEGNFSNRVQDVIRLSREEAIRLGHHYIGTEHLLLGIVREGEGIAAGVLVSMGVDLDKTRQAVIATLKSTGAGRALAALGITTARLREVLSMSDDDEPEADPDQT